MPIIEPFLLIWAGFLCGAAALAHSIMGERYLLRPLLAGKDPALDGEHARAFSRFAWHWTTVTMLLIAAVLVVAGLDGVGNRYVIAAIGAAFLAAGFYVAIVTRGRLPAWPLMLIIGALVLTSLYLTK